jgi:tetratricopeptide (TPR) repeat protein
MNKSLNASHRLCHLLAIINHFRRPVPLRLLIPFLLIWLTVIAFWQVRHNDFINLDDRVYVTNNAHVKEGLTFKSVYWAFTSTQNGQWNPVACLSHLLDYTLFGLNAGGHHVTNLLFHIINSLLLFFLLRRMTATLWQSGFVAAIFALHPLHVESVAWIAERRDVLHAFFFLLTIWSYINYLEKPQRGRHISVLLCFVLAVMSKPMAVTLPFTLLLLDYWPLDRVRIGEKDNMPEPFTAPFPKTIRHNVPISTLVIEKVSLFSVAVVISLFTLFSAWGVKSLSSLETLPLTVRIENATVSYIEYILKTIWPKSLAVLYPHPMTIPVWKVVCSTLLLLTITILVTLGTRKHPYLIVGWLWYLITLLPVIGLLQAGIQSMADRFMYMPMIGLLMMAIYGISDMCKRWSYKRWALAVLGVLLLISLIVTTRAQVKLWRNSEALFRHTIQVTNNNYLIYNYLGAELLIQGRHQEALIHFNRSLEINPSYADAHCNLGVLLLRQGKYREAISPLHAALQIKPEHVEALTNLGIILSKYGKVKEAMHLFSEAMRINPKFEEAYFNQGNLLLKIEKYEEAIHYFNEALKINPGNSITYNSLGVSSMRSGNAEKAVDYFYKALDINPDDADAHCNLGSLFIQQGKYEKAIFHLTETLRVNPSDGEAHLALGTLHLKMNQKELALQQYTALKNINPKMADTLFHNISQYRN